MPEQRQSTTDQATADAGGEPASDPLEIEIIGEDSPWSCLAFDEAAGIVQRIARALAGSVELPSGGATATLVLSSDARVRALNAKWRGKDSATNVLSFPSGESDDETATGERLFLGDVIIAEQTMRAECIEGALPPSHHFHHLALHGLLHLLGYDHEAEDEAAEMEALETAILANLGIPDPYAGTEPVKLEGGDIVPSAKS